MAAEVFSSQFGLDPTVAYLNHGSYGATPLSLLATQRDFLGQMESNPVRFFNRELPGLLIEVRQQIAKFVGLQDSSGLVLLPNTTTGINAILNSLQLQPGDEVVVSDHEYGAMKLLFEEVSRKSGAQFVIANIPIPLHDKQEILDAYQAVMTERTVAILFSHISSLSAMVFPAQELCHLAREAGVLSIVDGAHALGQIRLDIVEINPDCYVSNTHKWLCGPKSGAFLYASGQAREWISNTVVSWGFAWDNPEAFLGRFFWRGTYDPSALLCVPQAIQLWETPSFTTGRFHARALAAQAISALQEGLGAEMVCPLSLVAPQMTTFSLPLPTRLTAFEVGKILYEKYAIEIPVERFLGFNIGRLSAQVYNRASDYERLVVGLGEILT